MKKAVLPVLTALAITVSFTSCQKTCDEWHEGKNCETEIREKYYGTYEGTSSVTSSGQTSTNNNAGVLVTSNTQGPQYLSDAGNGIYFKLRNSTEFDIPSQPFIVNGTTYTAEGNGSITTTKLSYSMVASNQSVVIGAFFEGFK